MMILKTILCLVSIILLIFGFLYGQNIQFSEQRPLFEALRSTASIIFAVIGAWAAIIYPERLKLAFHKDGKTIKSSNAKGMEMLMTPIFQSTILLVILLLIGVVAPIMKQFEFALKRIDFFRGLSYSFLVLLTLWQIFIVIRTLFPAKEILSTSQREDLRQEMERRTEKLSD